MKYFKLISPISNLNIRDLTLKLHYCTTLLLCYTFSEIFANKLGRYFSLKLNEKKFSSSKAFEWPLFSLQCLPNLHRSSDSDHLMWSNYFSMAGMVSSDDTASRLNEEPTILIADSLGRLMNGNIDNLYGDLLTLALFAIVGFCSW